MAEYIYARVLGCIAQACCNLGLIQCAGGCGTTNRLGGRLADLIVLYVFAAVGLFILFYGSKLTKPLISLGLLDCEGDLESVCLGVFTLYRMCCCLMIFHLVLLLFSLAGPSLSSVIESGFWPAKLLILGLLLLASFCMGNEVFVTLRDGAKIASIIFLVIQSVFLIDFAYEWSETWVTHSETSEDTCFWRCWLLTATAALIGLTVFLTVCNFSAAADCGFSLTSTVLGSLGVLLLCGLSLLSYFENGSLLTSSFVGLYCVYQQWSVLRSNPETCWDAQSFVAVNVVLGLAFMTISVIRMALRTSNDSKPAADSDSQTRASVYYRSFMCLCCMYLAMLLTHWGSVQVDGEYLSISAFGQWLALGLEWVTIAAYAWTLLAPKCISDREFY